MLDFGVEALLVVSACGSNTGWHYLIQRAERHVPHLSNYAGAAGGRTFPSAGPGALRPPASGLTHSLLEHLLAARTAPAFVAPDQAALERSLAGGSPQTAL